MVRPPRQAAQPKQPEHAQGEASGREAGFVLRLNSIARSTRQLLTIKLAEIGVVAGQDHLFDVLDPHTPRNVVAIAEALSVRASTVSKMLDVFVDKGWAEREACKGDKRKVMARLTPLGNHQRRMVHEVWAQLEVDLAKALGDAAIGQLAASAGQIDDLLTRLLARLR